MKKLIYFAILISAVSLWSCKCSKKAQKADDSNSTTQVTPFNEGTNTTVDKYRIIVSFISRGEGPDLQLMKDFDNYISKYEKEKNKKMIVDKYNWGKEGEIDYCLELKQITSDEQNEFVKGAKALLGTSDRAIVSENASCKHKK